MSYLICVYGLWTHTQTHTSTVPPPPVSPPVMMQISILVTNTLAYTAPKLTNLTHTAFCTWFNSASLTWDSGGVHKWWSVRSLLQNDKHNLQAIGIIKWVCLLQCLSSKCVHLCRLSYNPKLPLVTTAKNKTLESMHRSSTDSHVLLSKQAHKPFCPSPRSPWEPFSLYGPPSLSLSSLPAYKLLSVLTLKTSFSQSV